MLVPNCSCTSGAADFTAARGATTAGSGAIAALPRLGRLFRGEPAVGDDCGNDVADVTDLGAREGRTGSRVHGPPVAKRHRMYDRELAVPRLGPILGREG